MGRLSSSGAVGFRFSQTSSREGRPFVMVRLMGAWGTGPFDNDAAADFLGGLHYAPTRSITKALKTISKVPHGQYIEVDDGSAAWAACELVALSFGYGDASALDDAVLDVVGRLKPKEDQRLLALSVVPRIAASDTSEIAALWHEGDSGAEFDNQLRDQERRPRTADPHLRPDRSDRCPGLAS